ncbi:hypothetical protein [Priestia megaterium]|uniref:hypothetical protein n=1 Tax=Priestia megaterium TaxID=1404 RepID=UPI0039EAB791
MQEFIIDYTLKDTMDEESFAKHIKAGIIRECKEKQQKQKTALELANSELLFHNYDLASLSGVKYHWKTKK